MHTPKSKDSLTAGQGLLQAKGVSSAIRRGLWLLHVCPCTRYRLHAKSVVLASSELVPALPTLSLSLYLSHSGFSEQVRRGCRSPEKGADLRGSPGNFRGSPGAQCFHSALNFRSELIIPYLGWNVAPFLALKLVKHL